MARDNFSAKVIERLRSRVAHRCSNPDCRVVTIAPDSSPDGTVNIGVAAHIHAASPGGPRYCALMTKHERTAIGNGIWLCAGCAIKIDRDVLLHTPETLRQWKQQAEAQAMFQIGKALPREEDARDQVYMALARHPIAFAPTAIQNVHAASSQVLENLDPRFHVETSYVNCTTHFTLRAKEHVPLSLKVDGAAKERWKSQISALLDHGETARLSTEGVKLLGSPLFESVLNPEKLTGGQITFEPQSTKTVAKLSLIDEQIHQRTPLDDITGLISFGRKSLTFKGTGYSDLLALTINVPTPRESVIDAGFTIETDLERWVGGNVQTLPYFDKLADLYRRIGQGWTIEVQLEIEGSSLLRGRIKLDETNSFLAITHNILEYTNRARKLAARLKKNIIFQLTPPFTAEDHQILAETVTILDGKETLGAEHVNNITCSLTATNGCENIHSLIKQDTPSVVAIVQPIIEPIIVFGQAVNLPELKTTLNGVKAKILDNLTEIKEGDAVRIEWVPSENFSLERHFEGL